MLPADGAPMGCQAVWAKAGASHGSVARAASQSLPGKARKDWSPTTSPYLRLSAGEQEEGVGCPASVDGLDFLQIPQDL